MDLLTAMLGFARTCESGIIINIFSAASIKHLVLRCSFALQPTYYSRPPLKWNFHER